MKTTIYMIRHCESEGNACRRSQARFDGIVTRKGLEQSQVLANYLKDFPITAIYSSDAYRCRVTAEPLAKALNLPIKYRMLLREYTIGTWEGYSIGYTANRFPDLYERWLTAPYDHNIPGADPFWLAADRGYEGIRQIAAENPGGTVVAITHSCTLNCALTKVLGQPISYYTSVKSGDNTAITMLEVDENGNIEAKYINDDSHLPDHLLRHNYTGRSAATNFDFHPIDFAKDEEKFQNTAETICKEFPNNTPADLKEKAEKALEQNSKYAMFATLPDRITGLVTIRKDESLPADHGLLETLFVVEDLRHKGYTEQAMGEAIDLLRRDGCRYLVVKENEDPHTKLILERFCFESMEGGMQKMALTVPGLDEPVY